MQNNFVLQKSTVRVGLIKRRTITAPTSGPTTSTPARFPRFVSLPNTESELRRVWAAWRSFQATRRRNAVFEYLTAVFDLVSRWRARKAIEPSFTARAKASTKRANKSRSMVVDNVTLSDSREGLAPSARKTI